MVFLKNKLLTILLVVGVLGAAWGLTYRYSAESHNKAVEIAVDYTEVSELAGASGVTVQEALTHLKTSGATSVAVQERTVEDLVSSGMVKMVPERSSNVVVLGSDTPDVLEPLVAAGRALSVKATKQIAPYEVVVAGTPEYVQTLPVGLPKEAVDAAQSAKMPVVARLVNYPDVTPAELNKSMAVLASSGVHTVIFAADQVLGFRSAVSDVADALKDHKLAYGSIEFSKQKGDEKLSQKMLPNVVRVHSITGAEMGTIEREAAIERFVKAARERNVRLMYVRMFDMSDSHALQTNGEYVEDIAKGLTTKGFKLESAHPFKDPGIPAAARGLIGLGVAAGAVLLLLSVVKIKPSTICAICVVLSAGFAGVAFLGIGIGLKLIGLIAGIVFPSLAVINSVSGTLEQPTNAPLKAYLGSAVCRFAGAFAVTVAGGLMIAALLAQLPFMLRIDQYAGVKLAHLLPLMIVAFVFTAGIGWAPDTWEKQKSKAIEAFRNIGSQPILFWQSALALVLLVVVGLLLARSGNDSGVEVSGIELRFRAILDTLLFVRPRTKEFLLGNPAFLIGLTAALGGRRNWAVLLLVLGTIGEVSILNTFCHIHTPIQMSIIRCVIGAVLGVVLGVVILLLLSHGKKISSASAKQKK